MNKRRDFSRTRKNHDSDTSHAEKSFSFQGHGNLRQRHFARRKELFFSRTWKSATATLRTQKRAFLFKDMEIYDSYTSHTEKSFSFQGHGNLRQRYIAVFQGFDHKGVCNKMFRC
ncbi:hypothetical protein [Virgibacillus proomii]|uniref:hypothetical protein n=1 Tax=Virgibacillus proomii TaxID=84407 RepID=UPI001C0FCC26|nr:hypothetical protein [Virgibacillus proomii]MBU5268061.1 hypothetical protein [Virgibacillus proomii]